MTTPAPSFTPGPFRTAYSDNGDFRIMRGDGDFGTSPYDCFDKPKHLHHDIQALCEVTNSLYAYAKAQDLFERGMGNDDFGAFLNHLRSLGWDGTSGSGSFLHSLRAAALAQAEGTTHV